MILSGQEMPTADVALFSRLIFCQFNKTDYSELEKKLYDKLKNLERDGLAHLSAQLILHRAHFEKEFYANMDFVVSDIFDELKEEYIEDRILRSWCTIVAAFKTMQNKVNFGFGYSDIRNMIINAIREQNSQVSKSNEIGQFWDLLEAMYDENNLIEGWHFRITPMDKIKTSTAEKVFKEPKTILRFKFNSIAKLYAENSRKSGLKPLPADTLSYYLKNSKAFIGIQPSVMFTLKAFSQAEAKVVDQKTITSAFCFDYKKLGINLSRAMYGEDLPNQKDADEQEDMVKFTDKKANTDPTNTNGHAFSTQEIHQLIEDQQDPPF
jgi:DNA primase